MGEDDRKATSGYLKRLLEPLELPPLDREKLKAVSAVEEVELRRVQAYAKTTFRVLLIVGGMGFLAVAPYFSRNAWVFASIGGAAVLLQIVVTVWYGWTRNPLAALPSTGGAHDLGNSQKGSGSMSETTTCKDLR